jgi:glycerate kinase
MSDGGDGFGEVISRLLGAVPRETRTVDAAHHPCEATWWWHAASRTAIIESARVVGLAMLPAGKFHPFELDTFGLGAVLHAARAAGALRCLVGIGGSATNDGGFGLARGLGWHFHGRHHPHITRWTELHDLAELRAPDHAPAFEEIVVAVDVQNPLLGPAGCSRVYGPQKGLRPDDFEFAERCLGQLASAVARHVGRDIAALPGAGAAGGLGFGLCGFVNARMEPGFGLFARHARLEERLRETDLVLTGEGAIDEQTLMGKGVGELGLLCRQAGRPCVAFAGVVKQGVKAEELFTAAHPLTPAFTSREAAMANTSVELERIARFAAGLASRPDQPGAGVPSSA